MRPGLRGKDRLVCPAAPLLPQHLPKLSSARNCQSLLSAIFLHDLAIAPRQLHEVRWSDRKTFVGRTVQDLSLVASATRMKRSHRALSSRRPPTDPMDSCTSFESASLSVEITKNPLWASLSISGGAICPAGRASAPGRRLASLSVWHPTKSRHLPAPLTTTVGAWTVAEPGCRGGGSGARLWSLRRSNARLDGLVLVER